MAVDDFIVVADRTDDRLDLGNGGNVLISDDLLYDTLLRVVEIPIRQFDSVS